MADYDSPSEFFGYREIQTQTYDDTLEFFSIIQYTTSSGKKLAKVFGEGTVYSVPDLIDQKPSRYQYDSTIGWLYLSSSIEIYGKTDLKDREYRRFLVDKAILDVLTGSQYRTEPNTLIIFEQDMFHDNVKDLFVETIENDIMDGEYD